MQPISRALPEYISFEFTYACQKHLRTVMPPDSLAIGLREAARLLEELELCPREITKQNPPPEPKKPKREVITTPRVKCVEHREKSFVFSSGETKKCCTHDDCLWGRGRKTHSDKLPHPPVECETDNEVEVEDVLEVPELSLGLVIPVAGEDQDESEEDIEETREDFVERDLEEAEEFSREGGLVAACE